MVLFAIAANEGGRTSSAPRFAACAGCTGQPGAIDRHKPMRAPSSGGAADFGKLVIEIPVSQERQKE
jgi:hypothetical protein